MLRRGAVQCVVGLCRGRRGSSLRRIRALQEVSGMWSFCALSKHLPAVPALPPLPVASASGSLVCRLGPAIVSGSITFTLPLCLCLPRPVRLGESKMSSRNWAFVWCNSFLEIGKEFSLSKCCSYTVLSQNGSQHEIQVREYCIIPLVSLAYLITWLNKIYVVYKALLMLIY